MWVRPVGRGEGAGRKGMGLKVRRRPSHSPSARAWHATLAPSRQPTPPTSSPCGQCLLHQPPPRLHLMTRLPLSSPWSLQHPSPPPRASISTLPPAEGRALRSAREADTGNRAIFVGWTDRSVVVDDNLLLREVDDQGLPANVLHTNDMSGWADPCLLKLGKVATSCV